MRRLWLVAIIAIALNAGVTLVGAHAAHAGTVTVTAHKRCVNDDVNGGHVCTILRKYPASSSITREGLSHMGSFNHDDYTRVTYLGIGRRDVSNGRSIRTVRSSINHRWHTYKVRPMTRSEVYEMGQYDGAHDLCQEVGGTWSVKQGGFCQMP